jgi:hypothetical protein
MKTTLILSLAAALIAGSIVPAVADDQAKIDATLGRLGKVCKDKLMVKYPGVPMSDLHVTVAATLKQDLDSGAMGLKDLQQYGASYNWSCAPQEGLGLLRCRCEGQNHSIHGQVRVNLRQSRVGRPLRGPRGAGGSGIYARKTRRCGVGPPSSASPSRPPLPGAVRRPGGHGSPPGFWQAAPRSGWRGNRD